MAHDAFWAPVLQQNAFLLALRGRRESGVPHEDMALEIRRVEGEEGKHKRTTVSLLVNAASKNLWYEPKKLLEMGITCFEA